MAQDDVTDPKPLSGGRQRANHIQVHRLELGLWERKHIESILVSKQIEGMAKSASYVVIAGSLGVAAYATYWALEKLYGFVGTIEDTVDVIQESNVPVSVLFGPMAPFVRLFGFR
jgi:hypothetical protein